jgi:molecular chaperone DnaJ
MATDFYVTLEVDRSATDDEIKRAYRRLARQYHPDVNPDPVAADRFKAVSEAYEVLKDPRKRATYDRYGHAGVRGVAGGGAAGVDIGDISDLFEQFFGGFGGRQRQRPSGPQAERGADMRLRLKLTFREAVFGVRRSLEVVRRETCEGCEGSGAAPGTAPTTCPHCSGTGQVRHVQQSMLGQLVNVRTCAECEGTGLYVETPCPDCRGRGRSQRTRALEIDVPAGVDKGTQVRLTGEGEHGRHGGPPGDLFIVLDVEADPTFQRDGDDVLLDLRINPADAALGAEIEVPTLDGVATVQLPAGTQTGDNLRIPGEGVPHLRRTGRGDQVVTVFVKTPDKLTREQRDLLEQLRSTLPRAEVVERGSRSRFWDRVKERFS